MNINKIKLVYVLALEANRLYKELECMYLVFRLDEIQPLHALPCSELGPAESLFSMAVTVAVLASRFFSVTSSGSIPRARSPKSRSISSSVFCFVSLKRKYIVGRATTMSGAASLAMP